MKDPKHADWLEPGYQLCKPRRPKKPTPAWAASETTIRKYITQPLLADAERRVRIAYLYWCLGWNAREVAEEMRLTPKAVRRTIERLQGTA